MIDNSDPAGWNISGIFFAVSRKSPLFVSDLAQKDKSASLLRSAF